MSVQHLSGSRLKCGVSFLAGTIASMIVFVCFAFAPVSAGSSRKCVGMFVDSGRRAIAADSAGITVVGVVPCADRVIAWQTLGVYRAFDDGRIEFLATPTPPCPESNGYVWLSYPNPMP